MTTPIENAINIGPKCGDELRSVGIDTIEKLRQIGWEEAFDLLIVHYPNRIHTMYCYALIGAIENVNCLKLDQDLKLAAKRHVQLARINHPKQ